MRYYNCQLSPMQLVQKVEVARGQLGYISMSNCSQVSLFVGFLISWISLPTKTTEIGIPRIKVISQYIVVVILFVEETRVPGENHRPVTSHWQTLSHNVVSSTLRLSRVQTRNVNIVVIGTDCTSGWKSNYHTNITTTC